MALVLTVADSADGSGGIANVSGVNVSAVTTVYYAAWTGEEKTYTWVSAGSITGNGNVALALATGHYQWQAISILAGTSEIGSLIYQALTDAAIEAVHYAILGAVKTRIVSLALPGLTTTKVQKKWVPRVQQGLEDAPVCIVSPLGTEEYPDILTAQDDVGYPVLIALIDKLQGDIAVNMNRDLLWRQKIQKAFRNQRLPGVPSVINCKLIPDSVVDPAAFGANYFLSAFILRFISRQTRGLS